MRVLDMPCGEGRIAGRLARMGCEVVGVDYTEPWIELARKQYPEAAFHRGDMRSLEYDQEFDADDRNSLRAACVGAGDNDVQLVDAAAGRIAEEAGYKMSGFVGHSIGLETMETPFIQTGVTTRLEAGMTLCIEPGLTAPGVGHVSIEQEIVVRRGGPELLTRNSPRTW